MFSDETRSSMVLSPCDDLSDTFFNYDINFGYKSHDDDNKTIIIQGIDHICRQEKRTEQQITCYLRKGQVLNYKNEYFKRKWIASIKLIETKKIESWNILRIKKSAKKQRIKKYQLKYQSTLFKNYIEKNGYTRENLKFDDQTNGTKQSDTIKNALENQTPVKFIQLTHLFDI
jgi:hypothetical protein